MKRAEFWNHVAGMPGWGTDPNDCWPWRLSHYRNGYGQLTLEDNPYKKLLAHRVAFELALGPIPDGKLVLHRCDNRSCCNPAHLFLGTQKDNIDDMILKGRASRGPQLRGEAHPRCKFNDATIANARAAVAAGETQRAVAKRYGISKGYITQIIKRQFRQ